MPLAELEVWVLSVVCWKGVTSLVWMSVVKVFEVVVESVCCRWLVVVEVETVEVVAKSFC